MKKGNIQAAVAIPEGVTARLEGRTLHVEKGDIALRRRFTIPGIGVKVEQGHVKLSSAYLGKRMYAKIKTQAAHVRNLFTGATQGYRYTLKVVHAHFPMTVKQEENEVVVSNFAGEKNPRRIPILGAQTQVKIKGKDIEVSGPDKEAVGQTAANIERGSRVKGKDFRIFQDGVYITGKALRPAQEGKDASPAQHTKQAQPGQPEQQENQGIDTPPQKEGEEEKGK